MTYEGTQVQSSPSAPRKAVRHDDASDDRNAIAVGRGRAFKSGFLPRSGHSDACVLADATAGLTRIADIDGALHRNGILKVCCPDCEQVLSTPMHRGCYAKQSIATHCRRMMSAEAAVR